MRPVLRWATVVAIVGIGASAGAVALADGVLGTDDTGRYRLAAAAVDDVAQTVSTNGTVDFVNRADVSFGTGGTLASLSVRQGQRVRAGQRLGTLDTAALRAAVDSAEADLANAQATLEADQQRQADAVDADLADDDAPPPGQLAKRQRAVRAAQTAAGKAIATAKAALSAQHKACATTPTPDPDKAASGAAAPDAAASGVVCSDALAAVMSAQQAVARAQDTLQRTIGELAAALNAQASEKDTPEAERDQAAPTAASIAADQAAVDAAEVDLLSARHSLAQATLTAPIAGTVASVDAATGDTVSAASPVVVLIGAGAAVVETTVPVERIDEIEVGQLATVTPSGAREGATGTVTRIGRLAANSADSGDSADSVSYPVTVTVDEPTGAMPAGSTAGVDIVVDTAEDVLTVPTSAVHGREPATVTVLAGTQASQRDVTVGAVGPLRTEITGGLDAGERVVLADLDTPLPSADDQRPGPGDMVVKGSPRGAGPPVRIGR